MQSATACSTPAPKDSLRQPSQRPRVFAGVGDPVVAIGGNVPPPPSIAMWSHMYVAVSSCGYLIVILRRSIINLHRRAQTGASARYAA